MKKKAILVYVLFFLLNSMLIAQNTKQTNTPLPNGYRSIHLGMTLENTKEALKQDSFFGYRGERDVSLLPSDNKSLIETIGNSWLDYSWFQFYNEKLYTITLNFNPEKIDYYSLFTTLCEKYDNPNSLSPDKTIWENENIRLVLEHPCSIKYIDLIVFNSLLEKNIVDKSAIEILRENVLDSF